MLLIWLFQLALFVKATEFHALSYTGVKGRISTTSALENWFGSSSCPQSSSLASYFQSVAEALPEKPANFEVATLLCPGRPRKILFVTPKLVDTASEAVKSIFLRQKCKSIGLLIRGNEAGIIQPIRQQSFFFSQLTVNSCKAAFRRAFGIELKLVLVNTGCDSLPEPVLQDFEAAKMILFRHPSCFVDDQFYFDTNGRCQQFPESEDDLQVDSSSWIVDLTFSLDFLKEYTYCIQYKSIAPTITQQSPIEPPTSNEHYELEEVTLTSTPSPQSSTLEAAEDDDDYEILDYRKVIDELDNK